MLNAARELDMLTIGYAFNEEDTQAPDARGRARHLHLPCRHHRRRRDRRRSGGVARGHGRAQQEHFDIARAIKPDVILLAHGAAIVEPEHAQYMLDHTGCHGVQLGSSIERMAIERPIEARAAAFKAAACPERRQADAARVHFPN